MRRVVVGDVGGTHTRLARVVAGEVTAQRVIPSRDVADLATELAAWVAACGPVDTACLAVAGPVFGGRAHLTNLGWTLDAAILSDRLGFPVTLINDFHAQALAMAAIGPTHRIRLAPTAPADQPPGDCRAVIGPGTGLGEAILVPDGRGGWRVVAGEGGHARYAPRGERALELLRFLTARFGSHVSVERVVSGPGIALIDTCLRGGPIDLGDSGVDPSAEITTRALAGTDPIAVEALALFVAALADEAANLALRCNAGVVDLTGGIPPRILPLLHAQFRAAFEDKGRSAAWLRTVPVDVVVHPDPGLLGATLAAEAS